MKTNSKFCCLQFISVRPPKMKSQFSFGQLSCFFLRLLKFVFYLSLFHCWLVSYFDGCVYVIFLNSEIPYFMEPRWHVIFPRSDAWKKCFFILSNLKAIDFGSKAFSYLSPALKFLFIFASPFHPPTPTPRSVNVVIFILSQHSSLLLFRCQSFLII